MPETVEASQIIAPALTARVLPGEMALAYRPSTTFEEWQRDGEYLMNLYIIGRDKMPWFIGDWQNSGDILFGELASQCFDMWCYTDDYLRKCAWVARRFPPDRRRATLSWAHHLAVAGIGDGLVQEKWLDYAEEKLLGSKSLEIAYRNAKRALAADPRRPALPGAAAVDPVREAPKPPDPSLDATPAPAPVERDAMKNQPVVFPYAPELVKRVFALIGQLDALGEPSRYTDGGAVGRRAAQIISEATKLVKEAK